MIEFVLISWLALAIINVWQSRRLARAVQQLAENAALLAQAAKVITETSRQWQLAEHNLERACAELEQHGATFTRDEQLPQERLS